MLTIIICAVLVFLVVSVNAGIGEGLAASFGGVLLGFVLSMLIGAVLYIDDNEWRAGDPVPLVSLGDNMGVEGHFFLGSGSVDGVPTFTWYQKTGPNDYVRQNVNADESTIHYITDGKKPYYVKSRNCSRASWMQTWGLNLGAGCWEDSYDFYVPKGSIVQSYTLDNK